MARKIPSLPITSRLLKPSPGSGALPLRFASTQPAPQDSPAAAQKHDVTPSRTSVTSPTASGTPPPHGQKKSAARTMAQLDEELRQKMSGVAGDGGEAGVEYEDGQPVAMKRSVKNNMFRYI
ncbi:hypothetical protein F4802DRAFT_602484 [Xylaria palmicola]|nr:hypothetical protein F4802DRAFT_602484 [Xylaria palmicola]